MNVTDFFFELIEDGLALRVEDGDLCYRGARGVLTPERREQLRASKENLLALLRPDTEYLPLSYQQQRLWLLYRLEPENSFYNMPLVMRLHGQLDYAALTQTFEELARRHEAFRTTFPQIDSRPVQAIAAPQSSSLKITCHDLRDLPTGYREEESERLTRMEASCTFDIAHGPLCRVSLLRSGEDEWRLLLTMHHIISDGWSLYILFEEISKLYTAFAEGEPSPLEPLAPGYSNFTLWQRQWMQSDDCQAQLEYWKNNLSSFGTFRGLPTDHPRPSLQSYSGQIHETVISPEMTASLKALSAREGATLFMVLLSTFQILLGQYSRSEEVHVGSGIANRNRSSTEETVGFFINTLTMQVNLAGNPTYLEVLRRVRESALGAYAHQDIPTDKVIDYIKLQPGNSITSHHETRSLFPVYFLLQNLPWRAIQLPDLSLQLQATETGTAKYDLTLAVYENKGFLTACWEFNTDLFEVATIENLASHYQQLLQAIVAQPELSIADLLQPTSDFALAEIKPDPKTPLVPKSYIPPRNELEEKIVVVWRRLLNTEQIGVFDDFFDIGGHSLLAIRLLDELEKLTGRQLNLAMFFHESTIAGQAALLRNDGDFDSHSLITLQAGGERPPLFCIDGAVRYRALAGHLAPNQPVYGLIPADATEGEWYSFDKVGARVRHYVQIIKKIQPHGPYNLAGLSFAGIVALMVAHELRRSGEEVGLLTFFDTYGPGYFVLPASQRFSLHWRAWKKMDARSRTKYLAERARHRLKFQPKIQFKSKVGATAVAEPEDHEVQRSQEEWDDAWQIDNLARRLSTAERDYLRRLIRILRRRPKAAQYPGKTIIFVAQDTPMGFMEADTSRGWRDFIPNLQIHSVPGTHTGMIQEPYIADVARLLNEKLSEVHGH